MKTVEQISLNSRVAAKSAAVGCDVDGEMVLLHPETGTYFGLNRIGAEIWRMIREETTPRELRDHLLREYPDVPRDRCEAEVLHLLAQLAANELVELRSDL